MSEWDWWESFMFMQFILSSLYINHRKSRGAAHALASLGFLFWIMCIRNWQLSEKGAALLKGRLDLNMQRFHFLHTKFKPWGRPGGKLTWAHLPRLQYGWTAGLPPLHGSANTETLMCLLTQKQEVEESTILLEEAAGIQRQRLGGVCFPGFWEKVTPPTTQTFPRIFPGQLSYSSLKKDAFGYRDEGESFFLTLPWGGNFKN